MKKPKTKAVVAVFVVVVLGVFGNSWLGGETWTSAAASAEAGWHAYVGPFTPQPLRIYEPYLIPVIMLFALIAVSVLGMILNRQSNHDPDDESPDPQRGAPQTEPRS